jgi:hypothetical protein
MKNRAAVLFFVFINAVFNAALARGAYGQTRIEAGGTIQWEQGEVNAAVRVSLASAGIKLPAGRIEGEQILAGEYPRILQSYLLSIQADSSSTVEDVVKTGVLSLKEVDAICLAAAKVPPNLSADLAYITGRYTVNLGTLGALLKNHRRAAEIAPPLVPSPAADYTGIVIIADTELPIHGRNTRALVQPCLFPKIWDTGMNLIYERNMTDPSGGPMVRYIRTEGIFLPTPSGLDDDLAALVGSNPLRIIARGVFGACPTDPVIDREDALTILSTENNLRLLREGRVALAVNAAVLTRQLF